MNDYTHENLITIAFKEENAMTITIEWIPLNICRYTKQIMVNGNLDSNPLTDELLKLFDNGIDLRIAKNPFCATHYLTLSDHLSYGLKVSLLRGIPILNTDWTDFIMENKDNFDRWFLELDPAEFLPFSKKDNRYLMPNKKRTRLLSSSMFVIFHDTKDKLSKWIGSLGGKVFKAEISAYYSEGKIDQNLLSTVKMKVIDAECDECFLMEFNDHEAKQHNQIEEALNDFAQKHSSKIVTEAMLYETVVNMSMSGLQGLNLERELKRSTSAEIVSSQPQRKRRKFKKVGITDFFDFKPPVKTEGLALGDTVVKDIAEEQLNINSDSNLALPDRSHPADDNDRSVVHTDTTLNDSSEKNDEVNNNITHKRQIDESTEEEPELKKRKEEKKIGKFIPQISLLDAIKSTKERAKENVREELGMDEKESDGLNENLNNLTIVETIDISIRRRKPVPFEISNNAYKERKNFKTFRKNKLLTNKRRNFIDMQPIFVGDGVDNVFIEKNATDKGSTQNQLKLMNDIGGDMGDVSGYKPYSISLEDDHDHDHDVDSFSFGIRNEPLRESTLFVPEDDIQREYDHTPTPGIKRNDNETRDDRDDDDFDDVDDDDDDDQPKFAFSRT